MTTIGDTETVTVPEGETKTFTGPLQVSGNLVSSGRTVVIPENVSIFGKSRADGTKDLIARSDGTKDLIARSEGEKNLIVRAEGEID